MSRIEGCFMFIINLTTSFLVVSNWLIFCVIHVSYAANNNTLTFGQLMKDGEFLESPNKCFRLRFFGSPQASSLGYLGIQFMNSSETDLFNGRELIKVVWVANRGNPLDLSSVALSIAHDGNLVLNNYHNGAVVFTIYHSQRTTTTTSLGSNNSSSYISATLLDTGNLVLRAGERTVWQSFDYPSDTWLSGMKLGISLTNSSGQPRQQLLTSWVSPEVPNLGAFTLGVDPDNTKQLVIWKRGVVYWSSGMWNGKNFNGNFSKDIDAYYNFSYFSNESHSYFTFTSNDNNAWPCLIQLNSFGSIYIIDTRGGFRSIRCDEERNMQGRYSGAAGCAVREPSNCTGTEDSFIRTSGLMYPWNYLDNVSLGMSDCEDMCRTNCSCTAYASALPDGTGCKFSDGFNFQLLSEIFYMRNGTTLPGETKYSSAYPPVYPPAYPPEEHAGDSFPNHPIKRTPHNARKRQKMFIISGVIAILIVLTIVSVPSFLWWKNYNSRGNNGRIKEEMSRGTHLLMCDLKTEAAIIDKINTGKKDHELRLFTLSGLQISTNYFSDANKIGQGGFGPVYKGKLVNGEDIAVKRLSRSSRQGSEEFENEVMLVSRLQHRNLVKLLGCCTQGDERILVYEYLPNKSLDSFLFDVKRRLVLDWKMCVCIIEGIAQGLQYLHKYSRLKIIHRDLKTSNILLDVDMNPKISDFGTARIFGDNESRANTKKIVGTYGYMSPEYAMDGLFSVKSDVFSFGVMMLEIISGKKNTGFYQPDRALNLLGYAWDLWKDGRSSEIMDLALVDTCSRSEVIRYIQVGFLCVQESAADRPTISEVVSMLNNEVMDIPAPKQPAFSAIVGVNDANTTETPKPCTVNNITISEECGR